MAQIIRRKDKLKMYSSEEAINRIYALMSERNMNCQSLEKVTGIQRSTINNWKSRSVIPGAETLCRLAEYFDVTVDYILTGKQIDQQEVVQEQNDNFWSQYNSMSPIDQSMVRAYANALANSKKKE